MGKHAWCMHCKSIVQTQAYPFIDHLEGCSVCTTNKNGEKHVKQGVCRDCRRKLKNTPIPTKMPLMKQAKKRKNQTVGMNTQAINVDGEQEDKKEENPSLSPFEKEREEFKQQINSLEETLKTCNEKEQLLRSKITIVEKNREIENLYKKIAQLESDNIELKKDIEKTKRKCGYKPQTPLSNSGILIHPTLTDKIGFSKGKCWTANDCLQIGKRDEDLRKLQKAEKILFYYTRRCTCYKRIPIEYWSKSIQIFKRLMFHSPAEDGSSKKTAS